MAQEKLGGQFEAWVRQGAKDLHNAIVPAFPSSVHSVDEPGTPLNPTQQMVTQEVNGSYQEFLQQRQQEGRERAADERGMER